MILVVLTLRVCTAGNVVVHCAQGKSRSVTVVIGTHKSPLYFYHNDDRTDRTAYLMVKQGLSVDDALKIVKGKRPEADPSTNFLAQLREFRQSTVRAKTISCDHHPTLSSAGICYASVPTRERLAVHRRRGQIHWEDLTKRLVSGNLWPIKYKQF